MIESLHLAKVPTLMIMNRNVCINGENDYISRRQPVSSVVYLIVKSDVIPFEQIKGICIGKNVNRNQDITHLFFVEDLKLFATNMSSAKTLLDLVTFSQDIGMKFGESKCAYLMIERGKQKCTTDTRNERNQDPTDKRRYDIHIQVLKC